MLFNAIAEAAPTPATTFKRHLGLVIFLLGVMVYVNSLPGGFIGDDIYIVAQNHLVESVDLRATFTTDYWGPDAKQSILFRPLTILSFAINRVLLGSAPWSYHLVNIFLHALVGLVLFYLLDRWGVGSWRAFFTAALFSVHPIHTEVLNEVVGRSELLVALFFLLGLYLATGNERLNHLGICSCLVLALLAKEHAITFLAALIASDLFFRRNMRARVPLYGAMLLFTAIWLLYRQFGLENGPRDPVGTAYQPLAMLPTPIRILTALQIQLLYLGKLLLPVQLQVNYHAGITMPVVSLFSRQGALICAVGGVLTGIGAYGWRRRELYGLAILLYAACFSVTANIFFVSGVFMAERSAYLPSAWFCLALMTLLPDPDWKKGRLNRIVFVLLALLLIGAGSATLVRNYEFGDPERLWSADFAHAPYNTEAGVSLIGVYIQKGEYGKAVSVGEQILKVTPGDLDYLTLQARVLTLAGRPAEALVYAEQALRETVGVPSEGLLMAIVDINVSLDRPTEALKWLEHFDTASRNEIYWEIKGNTYKKMGNMAKALDAYRHVGAPSPGSNMSLRFE